MSSSEIEENVNKIKELLKSEDFGVVNTGLALARSLDEEAVYEKLLEGCGVDKEGWLVNEKREISNYLVCSLASISNGQKAKEILDNVTNLDLSSDESINNVDGLANLTNIDKLDLSGCKSLTNVDGLANLTNLIELNLCSCSSLKNVDVLSNHSNLEYLNLIGCSLLPIEECHSSKDFIEKVNHSYNKTNAAWRDNFERYDALPVREGSVSVEIELFK